MGMSITKKSALNQNKKLLPMITKLEKRQRFERRKVA